MRTNDEETVSRVFNRLTGRFSIGDKVIVRSLSRQFVHTIASCSFIPYKGEIGYRLFDLSFAYWASELELYQGE